MTSVDECTRAETGVGAAIAAGSQLEKGIWALFVSAAVVTRMAINGVVVDGFSRGIVQFLWFNSKAIVVSKRVSPTRFISAVIMPAARAVGV